MAASPAEAYGRIKQQLRAPVLDKIHRAITQGEDPVRDSWFSPETRQAALAVLTGKR